MARDHDKLSSRPHDGAHRTDHDIDFEAEHAPNVARQASVAGLRREAAAIQKKASGAGPTSAAVHDAAARGVASPTTALPHAQQIQVSFGAEHDVSRIQAHVGGSAASAMGAAAFASGDHVVFDRSPDVHTAAHEAAHVVQQARGVNLYGGVGEAGDAYERHADAVADRVVAGQSAADLLGAGPRSGSAGGAVQRKALSDASPAEQTRQHDKADIADLHGQQSAIMLVAKHMQTRAATIDKLCESPTNTEAGASPAIQGIESCIADMDAEVSALNSRMADMNSVWSGMSAGSSDLNKEIGALKTGIYVFEAAVGRGKWFAKEHGQSITATTTSIDKTIEQMQLKVTKAGEKPDRSRSPIDGHPERELFQETMRLNLLAAHEAALSMRMEMTTGRDLAVNTDLQKLTRHLKQISDLLGQVTDQKALKAYKQRVHDLITEVHALEKESKTRNLGVMFHNTQLGETVAAIQAKIGHG